jgi:hypothetical protein
VETATQALHRLTSYEPGREWTEPADDPRLVHDLEVNDLDRFPWFCKRYPDPLPRIPLPRDLPTTAPSALSVLAGAADVEPADLTLPQLSRLLHLSAGVVRTMARPFTTWLFRAAGSAGGRFPLELYVAVPDGSTVPAGVYWYDPPDHALVRIAPPPEGDAIAVIVTGVPWRTGWRYRERGYRHVYWDAGTMLSQALAVADSAGIPARLLTRFPDGAVARLVGADLVHEWPVALVTLGDGDPAVAATGPTAEGDVDAAPREFPLVTAAQRAGMSDALGPAWDRGAPIDVEANGGDPMEVVVLARGSTRRMVPGRSLPERVLRASMGAAMRGITVPHFVVVHEVDGVPPGLYRWPDLSSPARADDLRGELYRVCLEQGLGSEAGFVVIGAVDVGTLDDREYREAQLAAGVVEGRLHLAAAALGAGASGMTFRDSDIPGLLDEPLDGLLFTCVGVPEYPSAPGGPPGEPTAVRRVTPRTS